MLALLALLVLDVSVGAQFPVPWGEPLTLRGAASFCLDFVPPPGKLWMASGSALNGRGKPCPRLILQGLEKTAAYQDETGKRYTGFMLQTLGLPPVRRLRPGARKAVVPAQSVMRKNCAST